MLPHRPIHAHPQQPDELRLLYRAWLASARPLDPQGKRVASPKNQRSVARGQALATATATAWTQIQTCWEQQPEKIWVWSDLHLGHRAIIHHALRPFSTPEAMDRALLESAQQRVKHDDWLLFLGDVSFLNAALTRQWLRSCPGQKALLLGNHDGDTPWSKENQDPRTLGFAAVADVVDWKMATPVTDADGRPIARLWFTHYPLWSDWIHEDTRCVHGHIHQHVISGRLINASVEHTDYAPARLLDMLRSSSARPRGAMGLHDQGKNG